MVLFTLAVSILPAGTFTQMALAKEKSCKELDKESKIKHIAKKVVEGKGKADGETQSCFDELGLEDKASVFEAMAVEQGIPVEQLRDEAEEHKQVQNASTSHVDSQLKTNGAQRYVGAPWRQNIEYPGFRTSFVAPHLWREEHYYDTTPDGTRDPDLDYIYRFGFSTVVSDPDAVRSQVQGGFTSVEAMLSYYQVTSKGIDGRGATDSVYVQICLGAGGVTTAGGPSVVAAGIRLSK